MRAMIKIMAVHSQQKNHVTRNLVIYTDQWVQLGGVKLPGGFPAAHNSKSMVHAGTGRWRQKNGRPMLIVGSRPAVYRMAVVQYLRFKNP